MTFFKNLLATLAVTFVILIAGWQLGAYWRIILGWLVYALPIVVGTLQFEDYFRKVLKKETRKLATWQYYGGMFWVFAAIGAWMWGAQSTTLKNDAIGLGATFLFGGAAFAWMALVYRPSVVPKEDRDRKREESAQKLLNKKWSLWRDKIGKAKRENAIIYLESHLAFRTVGDVLTGNLDFARPLIVVDGKVFTVKEAVEMEINNTVIENARGYLKSLIKE